MTAQRMCELGTVSRAGLYRFEPAGEPPSNEDLDLRDEIQRIALAFPFYGRPRITAELKRRGWQVNHKRVGRIMREDNLLCLRRRHGWRRPPDLGRHRSSPKQRVLRHEVGRIPAWHGLP